MKSGLLSERSAALAGVVEARKALEALMRDYPELVDRVYAEVVAKSKAAAFKRGNNVKSPKETSCAGALLGHPRAEASRTQPWDKYHPPRVDHGKLYRDVDTGDAKLFVSEPYDMDWKTIQDNVKFCEEHGLRMCISARSAHFPGRTVRVTYEKAPGTP